MLLSRFNHIRWLAMLLLVSPCVFWAARANAELVWNYVAALDGRALGGGESGLEASVRPEVDWRISDTADLSARVRLRGGLGDSLEHQPKQRGGNSRGTLNPRYFPGGDDAELELRELYLDLQAGPAFLRLGKQQIVWGQADGIKVLDVLNPQSFREFILDDFEESRIPLWSAMAEVPVGSALLQLTWIPDLTFHDVPGPDDWYAWTSPKLMVQLPAGVPVVEVSESRPGDGLADGEWAIQLSGFSGGWDWTLNHADHFEDLPLVGSQLGELGVRLDTGYLRSRTSGASVSRPLGNIVVRGEVAYRTDLPIPGRQANGLPGGVPTDTVAALVGIDFSGLSNTWLSLQVLVDRAMDHPSRLVRDRDEYLLTATADRYFLNRRLKTRVQAFHSPNEDDGLARLAIEYQLASRVSISLAVDEFYGPDRGLFGQFAHRDQIRFSIEFSR